MARANKNGWDFVKVGGIYQYKEDGFIGLVKVLKDTSNDEMYELKLQVLMANNNWISDEPFTISFNKNIGGAYSGQLQLYETPEYCMLPIGTPYPVIYQGKVDDLTDEQAVSLKGFLWDEFVATGANPPKV
jgi:hypothetical protein